MMTRPPTREPRGEACPTLPDDPGPQRQRRARLVRRIFLSLLAVFILAGLLGFFGVRKDSVTASEEGWILDFSYARTTRAGLAVPMEWEITKTDGFGPQEAEPKVVIRLSQSYFDAFDENSIDPTPSSEWSDGEYLYWEFDAPPNESVMKVSIDTRTGSSVQLATISGDSAVYLDEEERAVAVVEFKTWVMP